MPFHSHSVEADNQDDRGDGDDRVSTGEGDVECDRVSLQAEDSSSGEEDAWLSALDEAQVEHKTGFDAEHRYVGQELFGHPPTAEWSRCSAEIDESDDGLGAVSYHVPLRNRVIHVRAGSR